MYKYLLLGLALFLLIPASANADPMNITRLTTHSSWEGTARWSGDGSKIVFVAARNGGNQVWTMDSTGEDHNLQQITFDAFLARNPVFDPTSDSVCYTAFDNGGGIFKVEAVPNGTGRQLTTVSSDDYASYSWDGEWITFQSLRGSNRTEIYKMEDDTGESSIVRLTFNGYYDDTPVFSPDGLTIAFSSFRHENFEIFSMDARGEDFGIERLTETAEGVYNRGPSYSPDGRFIAFHSDRDGNYDLYYIDSRGEAQGLVRLTDNTNNDGGAHWCPVDDDKMVFNSNRIFGGSHDIYLGSQIPPMTDVPEDDDNIVLVPHNFELFQNYPNPFNPSTKIHVALPEKEHVTIKVYNLMGQEISTLVDRELAMGTYDFDFDGADYSSGIYFYVMKAGDFVKSRKMTLLK
ncbi:MAG: T9SS type A sorting domain-containing protein [candidate division Zixibacteria bacterium]|nr:T9SS type A sorting domain-containing protein [candidate division Zixibacteria bacterium]